MRKLFPRRTAGILAAVVLVVLAIAVGWLRLGDAGAPTASAATITVEVGDFWFCSVAEDLDCEQTVSVGDTVSWDFAPAAITHTTTECAGSCGSFIGNPGSRLWHSGNQSDGSFEHTFNSPGAFEFQCNIHPTSMRGRIVVQGIAPTAPPPPTAAVPTATPTLFPPPPTPAGLVGDANDSGGVDSIDAALILQFSAGLLDSLAGGESADADQNGSVDAIDAALVLQFVAGLLASLPP